MSAQQAIRHNLEQYKKQAKDLLKAYQSGDAQAVELVREHLPRLEGAADTQDEIILKEAQHVVARQHQFKDWNWLHAVSTLDFELLTRITDREIWVLLHRTEQKDLIVALLDASEDLKERILDNLSERLRRFFESEMSFHGSVPAAQIEDAQRRILLKANDHALQGLLTWPERTLTTSRTELPGAKTYWPGFAELAARPLEALSIDEMVDFWVGSTELARREGIMALNDIKASPLVQEALNLMVDGTGPSMIEDMLKTRIQHVLLGGEELRGKIVIEGLLAIRAGDNPDIVHHKLTTFFVDFQAPMSGTEPPQQRSSGEFESSIKARLQQNLIHMNYVEIATLLTEMAYIRRQVGLEALGAYVEMTEYPLLRRGLELVAAEKPLKEVMEVLETQLDAELKVADRRYRAVIAGALSVQRGDRPEVTEQMVRDAFA